MRSRLLAVLALAALAVAPDLAAAGDEPLRSRPLSGGLFNPLPGGYLAGWSGDTGLDIGAFKKPVFAVAKGTLDYAEEGHGRWTGKGDSPFAVRLRLDEPIAFGDRKLTHVWYAHLSSVTRPQKEGAEVRTRVEAGDQLGVSGFANGTPHLHLGFIVDGRVAQDEEGSVLSEAEVRVVLGKLANKTRLPR